MRKFGVDAPEFFEFQIEGSSKTYKIPLAASMPSGVLRSMTDNFGSQIEMLRKYMGDVVDELTAGTLSDILKGWSDESNAQGASVGESEASSE